MLVKEELATGTTFSEEGGIPGVTNTQETPYYPSRRRRKKENTDVAKIHGKDKLRGAVDEGQKLHPHDAPSFLSDKEKEFWNEVLESAPFLTFHDRWILAQFCKTAIIYQKSAKTLEDLLDGDKVDTDVAKIAKDIYRHVSYDYTRLEIMLGLTPGTRTEMNVPEQSGSGNSGHFND